VNEVRKRLDEIAKAIAGGADPEKFQKEMDRLLGTEMEEQDDEANERWERQHRATD